MEYYLSPYQQDGIINNSVNFQLPCSRVVNPRSRWFFPADWRNLRIQNRPGRISVPVIHSQPPASRQKARGGEWIQKQEHYPGVKKSEFQFCKIQVIFEGKSKDALRPIPQNLDF